jgi:ketol-acid reductoisomerase
MRKHSTTAVIGYGSQGRAWALNLRDSGRDLIVGIPSRHVSRQIAKKDKMKNIGTVAAAVKNSDIIIFTFPDHLHGRVFDKDIKPKLKPGSTLVFLHGFSVHFKTVIPQKNCDVILLAPLGPGVAVREKYLKKESIGYFYCIHQNATGNARRILNGLIKDLRIDKKTMIKTTFADEAIGDIFGEQAVLCGGMSQLVKTGFDTLVENGLSPDKAYLEVAYQLDLLVDLMKKYGIEGMFKRISVSAMYGSLSAGPKIIDKATKKKMRAVLKDIKSGHYAKRLNSLTPSKIKKLNARLKKMSSKSFEKSAKKFSPIRKKK